MNEKISEVFDWNHRRLYGDECTRGTVGSVSGSIYP